MSGRGRGRGRGGSNRGRGGRRGRGGFGRSRVSRSHNCRSRSPSPVATTEVAEPSMDDVKSFFMGKVSFEQHYQGQEENRDKYAAAISTMMNSGVDVVQNARVRALAASWARKDQELAGALISVRSQYTFVEVLKALTILDAGRSARVVEKKIKRLQCQKTKVSAAKLGKLKSEHDNLLALKPNIGTATGAVVKQVSKWVKTFTKDELEFFALHFPVDPWKKLTDICHFNPEKDFPALPWFLGFCFGNTAPEDSIVRSCKDINEHNVNELVQSHPVPYGHVKSLDKHLTDDSKRAIALKEKKIDTLLWYYENLTCASFDKVLMERLNEGEKVTLANGKLMERLLILKMAREGIKTNPEEIYYTWDWDAQPNGPNLENQENIVDESKAPFLNHLIGQADENISKISLPLEEPIVIVGDASGSMEVAIKTSVIIAGILTKITSAKLVFFDDHSRDAPYIPENVEQVLDLALSTIADNATAPAASLYPFYKNKEIVKTFIIVTDEEENEQCEEFWFAELFDKYYKEVFPARLVFVSFLPQHSEGQMVRALKDKGYSPLQFKLDDHKPDLTKLDSLIALLSLETTDFDDEVLTTEQKIKLNGLYSVFSESNLK